MYQTIHLIQIVFVGGLTLGLLGWCLYRLTVLFGIIRKPTKPTRRSVTGNQPGQTGKPVVLKKQSKAVTNLSKRVLYSAKPARD